MITLRRPLAFVPPLIAVLVLTSMPAFSQKVDEAVVAVENHYRDVKDLTAKVSQKNFFKNLGKTQKFDGMLQIKKPGKLRLEYTNGQQILIDGTSALFYSKKSEQVIKKAFTDFAQMNIPVAFLLGAAHIRDDFEVLQPDPAQPGKLELMPRKPGAAMTKLELDADGNGRILSLVIYDRSGNITTIQFSDIREDTGLDDKAFVFKVPKGTEIIEQ